MWLVARNTVFDQYYWDDLGYLSLFCVFVTFIVFSTYQTGSKDREVRHKRIEKVLSQLEDDDLDLLRERLLYRDGEDESIEALLNSPKQKNG